MAVATVATLSGLVTAGVGMAHADTGYGDVRNVYMNLNGTASATAESQYGQLISSLRAAAGHNYRNRNGVQEAQGYRGGLIRLSLSGNSGAGTSTMSLWITPQDLYVVGFSDNNGRPFIFNDVDVTTQNHIQQALGMTQAPAVLNFGGNYNSLRQMAGRGREDMPISYNDVWNSLFNLAHQDFNNQPALARSLSLMIQFTSEAARFKEVCGTMSLVMRSNRERIIGLPIRQQYLENNWAAISRFGYQISQDPTTAPRDFGSYIGTLNSWSDVARILALMLASYTLPGRNGNWATSEI
jgi:hypothetical protein